MQSQYNHRQHNSSNSNRNKTDKHDQVVEEVPDSTVPQSKNQPANQSNKQKPYQFTEIHKRLSAVGSSDGGDGRAVESLRGEREDREREIERMRGGGDVDGGDGRIVEERWEGLRRERERERSQREGG